MADDDAELRLGEWLPYQLVVTADEVSRAFAELYRERFGLSRHQWRVLAAVAASPGMTSTQVCAYSTLEKMQVSRAVSQLEEAGFLQLRVAAADRRGKELHLTGAGRRLHARLVPLALGLEADLLAGLSPREARVLAGLLPRLSARARELRSRPAAPGGSAA